ncbi:hypothetical protein T265_04056 [Opisthorchis viverrini]|uniref:Armadillo-like helical domain-containing protein n=1 Tax=Opisthorchis viverrini TaxID=6198 RepID=A0A075AH32_OPIVI|nr:hypothetical protein T265_04056 [Opisthorchis viverrini]KER29314.1 hypothetical protein T265_04056 [Opisthorchis viverrini]
MSGTTDRKRNQKGFLKEKVLQVYDKLFQVCCFLNTYVLPKGQDITQGRAEFWDDFFLLKANLKYLNSHFEKINPEDLTLLKPILNRLFLQCLHTAEHDKHRIRVANAVQTMDALVAGIYRCKVPPDWSENASEFLLSSDQVKDFMQRYTLLCYDTFREDRPERLRTLMLNSMRTFVTASSNFHANPFASGLLNPHIFDVLRLTLVNAQLRYHHGMTACKLLGLLTQLENTEVGDPRVQQFCLTDDELLLNGVSSTISLALSEYNVRFRQQHDPSVGFLSSVSSFFGTMFAGNMASNVSLRPCDSLLMCMYAITKNGAHFSTILSYSNANYCSPNGFDSLSVAGSLTDDKLRSLVPTNGKTTWDRSRKMDVGNDSDTNTTQSLDGSTDDPVNPTAHTPSNQFPQSSSNAKTSDHIAANDPVVLPTPPGPLVSDMAMIPDPSLDESTLNTTLEPRNLLADLLEYSPEALNSCHLCLLIVLCITENQVACSILHDPHITFKVWIHKHHSRYRKSGSNSCGNFSSRPIAVAILSLVVEFMRGHLMKKLPYRLYSLACSICHNLLCYQTKHRIRLDFDWKQLWEALLSLLQFVLNLDKNSAPSNVSLSLMQQILDVFNFCILHGDNFLQAADVYDDLYYELIRMRGLFDNVYEHGLLHSSSSTGDLKQAASNLVLQMGNIRSIVNHFTAKIAAFSTASGSTSLTETQVLALVRENYDSLTLRVYEDLDVPDVYNDQVDAPLFEILVDTVLKQTRKDCLDTSLELQDYFHELSVIY